MSEMDQGNTVAPEHRSVTPAPHAPLPWRLAGKGTIRAGKDHWVCSLNWHKRDGNGEFLLRACNSHYALVKELEMARARIEYLGAACSDPRHFQNNADVVLPRIDAALSAAKGET